MLADIVGSPLTTCLIKPYSINLSISALKVRVSPYNVLTSDVGIDISSLLVSSVLELTVNFDFKCKYKPLLS